MNRYSLGIAYLLWAIGGFGTLGLHRFYLSRHGTGLLWLLTGGVFWIGALVDLFRLPTLVQDAARAASDRTALPEREAPVQETLEQAILRVAKASGGLVSPAEVATRGNWSLDETRAGLDEMVTKGYAEQRATRSGTPPLVYVIPEFLTDATRDRLEEL